MIDLPRDATEASRARYNLACELTGNYPAHLGREIAITGSVSRGIADQHSDIELNLWGDELPQPDLWRRWLEGVGADEISPEALPNRLDDSIWITCRYRDIWIEVGWGTVAEFDKLIERIASGGATDLDTLQFADIILHAVPLRTDGAIGRWQHALAQYPDSLQAAIIADNTAVWSDPHVPGVRWALAARDERFVLAMRLLWDVQNILAVLYAINRIWQPDAKWTNVLVRELLVRPERVSERINRIFTLDDPHACIAECFTLIVDTLRLVSPPHDVSRALWSIESSLETEGVGSPPPV